MSAFLEALRDQIRNHEIEDDAGQQDAIAALDLLADMVASGGPAPGLYLWGKVGRGKSMLMNLFYESLTNCPKRRVHFHAFMQDVHARLQAVQSNGARQDPLAAVAAGLGQEIDLLCLDELEIVDIADATIVGRLFDGLFAVGVTIVATSNDQPDDLYRDGPNRQAFLPFIDRLKARMQVVQVGGDRDFRTGRSQGASPYLYPIEQPQISQFDQLWQAELGSASEEAVDVEVHGRSARYDRAAGPKVRARFEDLCSRSLSADDHLAFAERFHTVYLEGVPHFDRDRRDEARRFVTLIDALYEAHATLVMLADVAPEALFADSGHEDYRRTSSRLQEMRSESWRRADLAALPTN
ncbi:cell division protein ZapE [Sphingomonas oryzagri]